MPGTIPIDQDEWIDMLAVMLNRRANQRRIEMIKTISFRRFNRLDVAGKFLNACNCDMPPPGSPPPIMTIPAILVLAGDLCKATDLSVIIDRVREAGQDTSRCAPLTQAVVIGLATPV